MKAQRRWQRRQPSRRQALTRLAPVVVEDRVQHLIDVLAVAPERLPQHRLLHGASLQQRAVAASVEDRGARLEPVHAERLEDELLHQLRAVFEYTGAPQCRADGKAPFGAAELAIELPHLENADRRVRALQRDGEADVSAGIALPDGPGDEALEAFDRARRRRNEP